MANRATPTFLVSASLLLTLAASITAVAQPAVRGILQPASERKAAPRFALKDSTGKTINLTAYRGKVLLLDFWATWCTGCKMEIPWFSEFEKAYGARGFAVVGVSMDERGWSVVKPFLAENHLPYPILLGDGPTAQRFGIQTLPDTFLIDRQARVAAAYRAGLVDKKGVEANIKALLSEIPITPATSRLRPSVPAAVAPALVAQAAAPPPTPAQVSKPQQSTAGPRTAEKPLTFDVASVKPATVPDGVTINGSMVMARRGVPIPRDSGGPGTGDPGRIHYPLVSLKDLLGRAYDSYFEIAGPGWLDTQIVQVDATMPPNTTKEQFREMLRNLIGDRFGLKYHSEIKQVPGYALVMAKGGPKMKESADFTAPQGPDGGDPIGRSGGRGSDGFPLHSPLAPGRPGINFFFTAQGRRRVYAQQQTMREFADSLAIQLQQDAAGPTGPRVIVTDATNLTAKYDFELTYSRDGTPDAETLSSVFSALQSQLGLKLEPKKVPVDVMVIDHMEKTPTAN